MLRKLLPVLALLTLPAVTGTSYGGCPSCDAPTACIPHSPTCCAPQAACCKKSCCSKGDRGADRSGDYVRGGDRGEFIGESRTWGLRGFGIRLPSFSIDLPEVRMPHLVEYRRNAELALEGDRAPFEPSGGDRSGDEEPDCDCSRKRAPASECSAALEQLRNDEISLRQQIHQLHELGELKQARTGQMTEMQQQIAQQQQVISQLQAELLEAKACVQDTLKQRELDLRLARMASALDAEKAQAASQVQATTVASDEPAWESDAAPRPMIQQASHAQRRQLAASAQDVPEFESPERRPAQTRSTQQPQQQPVAKKKWWQFGR